MQNATKDDPIQNPSTKNTYPTEIAKFNDFAQSWWDPTGDFKPLHEINPIRANWICEKLNVAGLKGIDIGCGGGILTEALAYRGGLMTGIDMSPKVLSVAKQHLAEQNTNFKIDYQQSTAEAFVEAHRSTYDFVTCLEMLEHVPDPASVVKACFELAKPGASLFFSTINRNPKAFLFAIVGAEYLLKLLPRGTHRYELLIKPHELGQWIRAEGGQVEDSAGLTYNPLTKIYKLTSDISVNYMFHVVKQ